MLTCFTAAAHRLLCSSAAAVAALLAALHSQISASQLGHACAQASSFDMLEQDGAQILQLVTNHASESTALTRLRHGAGTPARWLT